MDTGSIQSAAPVVALTKSYVPASDLAAASGVNATRIEPAVRTQTDNNPQSSADQNPQQPAPQHTADKGYIFQPGVAGVIYQVKDEAGKVIDQTPSKQRLAQLAYDQKNAVEDKNHAADTLA